MWRSKALAIGATVLLLAGAPLACKKDATRGAEEGKQASGKKVLYWYDPMKPEVHFDHPGKSPFMDMQLEPKYAEEVPAPAASGQKKVLYWYDSMKPEVHFDHPGKSPFMDTQLEPKYAEEAPAAGAGAPPPGFSVVKIPLERRQEIGVMTAKVEKRTIGGAIETNGVVEEDEGRLKAVNAKFAGYIEKLYVDRTGQSVRRGQSLLTVYSPDLVATERELLLALENTRRLSSGSPQAASDASSLLSATRQRLRFWDIPESEIDRIEKSGEVSKTLTLSSPVSGVVLKKDAVAGLAIMPGMPLYTIADLSTVWVLADVYQSEMAMTAPGNAAVVSASFLAGETFRGRVDFIYPTLTEETGTIKVRVVIPNPKGTLKPGMFVRVSLSSKAREALAIPSSALIQTGERQIAFVEQSAGVYAPREMKIGVQGKDFVEVLSGLREGEMVVTSANFLIDSESRIGAIGAAPAGSAGQPAQSLGQPTPGRPPQ
jgi:membrane fusion protein, copper/silver efflux system